MSPSAGVGTEDSSVASKKNRGKQICSYCGEKTTSAVNEHVLFRKLFIETDRNNLPQVPACVSCNTHKSKLEDAIAHILPIGRPELERKFSRNSPIVREIASASHWRDVGNGEIRFAWGAANQVEQVEDWLDCVVRGLHRFHFGSIVPRTHEISIQAPTNISVIPNIDWTISNDIGKLSYSVTPINDGIGSIWEFDLFGFSITDGDGFPSLTILAFLMSKESGTRIHDAMKDAS